MSPTSAGIIAAGSSAAGGPTDYDLRWKMEETSGAVAADASGNGRSGTIVGSVTLNQASLKPGGGGKSFLFGGSGAGIDRAKEAWMSAASWTVCFWAKYNSLASNQVLFYLNTNGSGNPPLLVNISNQLNFQQSGVGSYTFTPIIDTNNHLYAVSFNSVSNALKLHIDGALADSTTAGGWSRTGAGPLQFAHGFSSFTGRGQDFRHYSRELTLAEHAAIYAEL